MGEREGFWRTRRSKEGSLEFTTFPQYDSDAAAKRLNPEGRAAALAVPGITPADDHELSLPEKEMLADVNRHLSDLREFFHRGVKEIERDIDESSVGLNLESNFTRIRESFKNSFKVACSDFNKDHPKVIKQNDANQRALRAFQANNNLFERPAAIFPESMVLHFAWVFAALIGEAILNAFFFQKAGMSWIEGFVQAFLISAVIVSLSVVGAFMFLRYVNHVSNWRKYLGLSMFSLSALGVSFVIVVAAHNRDVLQQQAEQKALIAETVQADVVLEEFSERASDAETWSEAIERGTSSPFSFRSQDSWLLMAFGFVVALVSGFKGYQADDEYPGYGRIFRHARNTEDELIDLEEEIRERIDDAYQDCAERAIVMQEEIKKELADLSSLEKDVSAFINCVHSYRDLASSSATTLLIKFRQRIQHILNDETRFRFDASLLDQGGGLMEIDPNGESDAVRSKLMNKIEVASSLSHNFEQTLQNFLVELESLRSYYYQHANIEEMLAVDESEEARLEGDGVEKEFEDEAAAPVGTGRWRS